MILPLVGTASPARQLKNVDLPAPLGPIKPTISPSSTDRFASRTAKKLPNALETACASRSMLAPPASRRHLFPQLVNSSGLVARDEHDDAAIENECEACAAATEPGVGRGLQRDQNKRADQRAIESPGTAKRGNDDHLHRHENAEAAFRIDEAGFDRVKRAGDRSENGTERERLDFYLLDGNAETARSTFAGLDRPEVVAESVAFDQISETQQHRQNREEDIVVRQLAAKGQVPPAACRGRTLQPDGRTDQIPRAEVDSDQLGNGNRRHAEIMTGQPERRNTDQDRERDAERNPERNSGHRGPPEQFVAEERCIGAEAEEHCMPDRNLARVATDDIPGRGRYRGQQKRDADVEVEWTGKDERINEQGCSE